MSLTTILHSQEGLPVYSDYLTDNYYLLHPAMAGAANCMQVRLTARKNWLGQEDAPGLQTLSINGRLGRASGIGANVFVDKNGYSSQSGAYLTYAHHLLFSRNEIDLNMLSFGLSVGGVQYRIDQTDFIIDGDALVMGGTQSTTEFNIDVGFSYHLYNFYTHVTAKNILKNKGVNTDLQITNNLRKYLISIGYVFNNPSRNWWIEPSVLLQYQEETQQSFIDLNTKIHAKLKNNNTIYGGLSYRKGLDGVQYLDGNEVISQKLNYLSPFVGLNFKRFVFAYTYTHQVNSEVFDAGGFHQLTLGIDLACKKKKYQCNCPAIN